MPHIIRLREPWQTAWDASTPSQPASPSEVACAFPAALRRLTASRRFNCPTGLTDEQAVLLQVQLQPHVQLVAVQLNEQPLIAEPLASNSHLATGKPAASMPPAGWSCNLRPHLQPFNHLQLTLALHASTPTPPPFRELAEAGVSLDS